MVKEIKIGNVNVMSIFLVLIVFVCIVIMLSISTKMDDFTLIEKDIKQKF